MIIFDNNEISVISAVFVSAERTQPSDLQRKRAWQELMYRLATIDLQNIFLLIAVSSKEYTKLIQGFQNVA